MDPHAAVQHAHDLCIRTGVFDRPWGLAGVWGGLVRTWLEELLPSDAAERCSGRVTVVVTELPWLATRSISSFDSREDLIDIALASAHVPLFLDGRIAAQCRGRWCIDGSFCYILFRWANGKAELRTHARRNGSTECNDTASQRIAIHLCTVPQSQSLLFDLLRGGSCGDPIAAHFSLRGCYACVP